ncbi:MAG: hypothetical protein ACRCZF_17885, partial [Gemmataceae bacterium]
ITCPQAVAEPIPKLRMLKTLYFITIHRAMARPPSVYSDHGHIEQWESTQPEYFRRIFLESEPKLD